MEDRSSSLKTKTEIDAPTIEAALAAFQPFTVEYGARRAFSFYDTFDWRLFDRTLVVRRSDNNLELVLLDGGKILHCNTGKDLPAFAWDLPGSDLRKMLSSLLEARALLKLASIDVEETTYRILNDNGTAAALEELIGSQDGVGGEQTDAFIFHPPDLAVSETRNSAVVFTILDAHRRSAGL